MITVAWGMDRNRHILQEHDLSVTQVAGYFDVTRICYDLAISKQAASSEYEYNEI